MATNDVEKLRQIKTFPSLVKYLRDELDWPIESDNFDDLTFDYQPEELGLDAKTAVKIKEIKQLRPLDRNQPWGIFFINFEPKNLPVIVLRRILSHLVIKKRRSANKSQQAAWNMHDLLFISSYGDADHRDIIFAQFSGDPASEGDLPSLRVLSWDDEDTVAHLAHAHGILKEKLRWPSDSSNLDSWRTTWSATFTLRPREVVNTSKALAVRLAELATTIRKRVNRILKIESEKGPFQTLYASFKEALIHDLKPDDFADMYAQTITYGLLSARVSRPAGLVADNIADMVPITNPFLRDLLSTFLTIGGRKGKIDFDEVGINDVVQVLREANMEAVLRDFGDKNPQEDPVVHFYELFLKEYDPKKRMQRGVFYTPRPVVSYIVRSVDELLRKEFGLVDGLADTTTWDQMVKRYPEIKIPEGAKSDEPFVQILDPATGTGTFLVEVIEVIHKTMVTKWTSEKFASGEIRQKWNEYVSDHLLPRLYGFELMMAPYSVAHMKIGLKLAETGYTFRSHERARIYLTNALEPAQDFSDRFAFDAPALAHEAQAVNAVKANKRFSVVIGNPPYSGISWNMTDAAQQLVDRYRYVNDKPLGERKLWLQNDYVKFLGFAHRLTLNTGVGCLGYITDNSYLDGPTFRGVRSNFLQDFSGLHVLNLHGSAKKMNTVSEAEDDQNVFEITQAVAVIHGVRLPGQNQHRFYTTNLIGTRQSKYDRLSKQSVASIDWSKITPAPPFFQFVKTNRDGEAEFNGYYSIKAAFPLQSVGIQTSRDHLAIDFTRQDLVAKIRDFASSNSTEAEIRERYFPGKKVGDYLPGDTRGWSLSTARKELLKVKNLDAGIVGIHYRPFDFRFVFNSTLLVDWPRPEVSEQMLSHKNLGLCLLRRTENARDYDYFSVSRHTISNHQVSLKDGTYLLPLYLESGGSREGLFSNQKGRRPNLSPSFLKAFASALQLPQKGPNSLPVGLTPEDIFHYTYAVFHAPSYRSRYAEFLKIDFPRLPLPGNLELFHALAQLGGELVALHLLESPKLEKLITKWRGITPSSEVEKITYSDETVWIDKEKTTGFQGVPESVWNFHIGGYQVCEKWLKDRKGRKLSKEDIEHYQKIVVALNETIRLMKEIDEVIEEHGGWPAAFSQRSDSCG